MSRLVLSGAIDGPDAADAETMDALAAHAGEGPAKTAEVVGTALPASRLIELARPSQEVRFCTVISRDGSYRASIPLDELEDGGWFAFRLGTEPLPEDAGGPVRLTVVSGRTLCWNVKDVGELRFTTEREPDDVPARPTH